MYVNLNYSFNKFSFGRVDDKDLYPAMDYATYDSDEYRPESRYTNTYVQPMRKTKKFKLGKATEKYGEYFFYRSCKRKKRYDSYQFARRAALKMHRRYPEKDYGVYDCRFCEGWHVFTKKKFKSDRLNTSNRARFNSFA